MGIIDNISRKIEAGKIQAQREEAQRKENDRLRAEYYKDEQALRDWKAANEKKSGT